MSYDNYKHKLLHTNISIIEVAASQLVEACGINSSWKQAENVGNLLTFSGWYPRTVKPLHINY